MFQVQCFGSVAGALGISVNEFNENKDLEVMTFRRNAMAYCKQYVDERESSGAAGLAVAIYPPDIHSTAQLPPHIIRTIQKGALVLLTGFSSVMENITICWCHKSSFFTYFSYRCIE